MKNLYLTNRFFLLFGGIIILFVLSYLFSWLFPLVKTILIGAGALVVVDILLLYNPNIQFRCERITPKVFSLGDDNPIILKIQNDSNQPLMVEIIDEVPIQFQKRDFSIIREFKAGDEDEFNYHLKPLNRGVYTFKNIHLFISSFVGLIQRRKTFDKTEDLPVYPSIIQMRKYSLKAIASMSKYQGIKKLRRIGHSYEFEQIKEYVRGDDYRNVNWKASSRHNRLMVNQYEEERSQQIYSIIDKSRVMKMPFNGMSLLDYAVNASLVISNVALQKHDKAGLLTFSDKIGTSIKAEKKPMQLQKILNALYKEEERNLEANYELLYRSTRNIIRGRSLLFLFTNFESMSALERVLPLLRKINTFHLLVVVFFENTELVEFSHQPCKTTEDVYVQTIAEKAVVEKHQIVHKLRQYGIQSILTTPEDLSINTINKYLELKSRGLV